MSQLPIPSAPVRPPSLGTFASLRHRDFRYLWTGTFFMSAGQWVQGVTLGWLAYEMTGSAVLLGALSGLRALPFLISGPIAGVVADRLDRRQLLIFVEVFLAATALGMGALVAWGWVEVWHIFVFSTATAVAWSFNQPVRQSLTPNVVPRHDLMNAIALNSVAFNITKVLGPAIGGVLIVVIGAGGNFVLQAACYSAVVYVILRMRVPATPTDARQSSMLANLKEGVRYVASTPTLLALMVANLVPNIFAMPYQALMPVFQKDVLGVGADGLGILLAAPGLGAVIATLGLASVSHTVRRKGLLLIGALLLLGFFLVGFSYMTSFPLALLMLVGVGGCQVFYAATTNTLIQSIVPDALRGRVMSIYLLDHGLSPLGSMLAGVGAHFFGAPATVAVMGAMVGLLALVVAWRLPDLREIRA